MAEYYVNIDNSYTTVGDGSSENAFNFNQFINFENEYEDGFYIKGSRNNGSSDIITKISEPCSIVAWDLIQFGPIRIKTTGNLSLSKVSINNGAIIQANRIEVDKIVNSYLKSTDYCNISDYGAFGSTIIGNNEGSLLGPYSDTIIDHPMGTAAGNFLHCAFSSADWGYGTKTNCQFSWAPPTWPNWNASDFSKTTLGYDTILTGNSPGHPRPGYRSPLFLPYPFDLSGISRDDIGAYASGELPPVPPEPPVTCWNFSALYKGTKRFFRMNGPGNCPSVLEIPRNVDLSTGCMIEHGKKVNFDKFKIL